MWQAIFILLFCCWSGTAEAVLTSVPGGFQDSSTGYIWRRIDSFFGLSYNEMVGNLNGFTISNEADLKQMHSSLSGLSFDEIFTTIGGKSYPDTDFILGLYAIDDKKFGAASLDRWNGVVVNPDWSYAEHNFEDFDADQPSDHLGLWAVDKSFGNVHTPEPATLLMMAPALLALRRKKAAHC